MTMTASADLDFRNYFLTWKDVIAMTGKSEMTIRRAMERNEFPSPVKMFGHKARSGSVGFRKADIYLWCEGRWNIDGGV